MGCNVAPDLESLARDCDLVITSLANDDVARSVYSSLLSGAGDAKSGPGPNGRGHAVIFVETSTLSWTLAGELEQRVRQQGHRYLQCPVFGPPPLARESKLVVVMSGDTEARNHAAPYLVPSIGRSTIVVGEKVESASKLKLLGNSMILGTVELLAEGMTLADKSGAGAEHLYEFVQNFFPAPSWLGCPSLPSSFVRSTLTARSQTERRFWTTSSRPTSASASTVGSKTRG